MTRRRRFEVPGIPQHVVQRGNNRTSIFSSDEDRLHYLHIAGHRAQVQKVAVLAYVLMGNHVHLLLSATGNGAISRFMHDLNSLYVSGFNARHGRTGSLWEGRFRSSLVDNNEYLWNCHRYIEFNPVRAGIVLHPGEYRWSSYGANALGRTDALITSRPEYISLGNSLQERCSAYRRRVVLAAGDEAFTHARLRSANALGSEQFEAILASRSGMKFPTPRPGRPRKTGPAD